MDPSAELEVSSLAAPGEQAKIFSAFEALTPRQTQAEKDDLCVKMQRI